MSLTPSLALQFNEATCKVLVGVHELLKRVLVQSRDVGVRRERGDLWEQASQSSGSECTGQVSKMGDLERIEELRESPDSS